MFGDLFCLSTWAILLLRPFVARNKRIILWSHGWYGREGIAKRLLKKVFFGLGDATFLYGEYAKSVAVKQGNRSDKLFVIHNSLDYDRQLKLRESAKKTDVYHSYFKNSDPTIIFVGRLTTEKRLEILIDALAKCRSMNHNYNLIFVGDGDKREYYEGIVKKYDIPVWFFGECYDEKKNAELIYNADLCVSPGNVGLTAMHTLMFGTPVITHDNPVNQMPEFEAIKSGLTGGFFSEGDVDDLAKKIVNWLSTVDRESIREACYKEIDTSWNPQFQIKVMESAL